MAQFTQEQIDQSIGESMNADVIGNARIKYRDAYGTEAPQWMQDAPATASAIVEASELSSSFDRWSMMGRTEQLLNSLGSGIHNLQKANIVQDIVESKQSEDIGLEQFIDDAEVGDEETANAIREAVKNTTSEQQFRQKKQEQRAKLQKEYAQLTMKDAMYAHPEAIERMTKAAEGKGLLEGVGAATKELFKGDVLGNMIYLFGSSFGAIAPYLLAGTITGFANPASLSRMSRISKAIEQLKNVGKVSSANKLIESTSALRAMQFGVPVAQSAIMGVGSYNVEYGSYIEEGLRKQGFDPSKEEDIKKAFEDDTFVNDLLNRANNRALVVGAFDYLSGRLAHLRFMPSEYVRNARKALQTRAVEARLGTKSPEYKNAVLSRFMNGRDAPNTNLSNYGRGIENMTLQSVLQGGLGGAGEALGSVAAGDEINAADVVAEIFGEFTTAPTEVLGLTATTSWNFAKDKIRADQAIRLSNEFGKVNAAIQTALQGVQNNETISSWAERIGEGKQIFGLAEDLVNNGTADEIEKTNPELADKIREASKDKESVAINVSDIVKIAATDNALAEKIVYDSRVAADGMSQREAEEFKKNGLGKLSKQFDKLIEKWKPSIELGQKVRAETDKLVKDLVAVGEDINNARMMVKPWEAWLTTQSMRLGIDPKDIMSLTVGRIQRSAGDAEGLSMPVTYGLKWKKGPVALDRNSSVPVVHATKQAISREEAINLTYERKVSNRDTEWELEVGPGLAGKSIGRIGSQKEKNYLSIVHSLDEILRKAIRIESHIDYKGRNGIRGVHVFATPIQFGGKVYRVETKVLDSVVRNPKDGHTRVHSVDSIEIIDVQDSSPSQGLPIDEVTLDSGLPQKSDRRGLPNEITTTTDVSVSDLLDGKNAYVRIDGRRFFDEVDPSSYEEGGEHYNDPRYENDKTALTQNDLDAIDNQGFEQNADGTMKKTTWEQVVKQQRKKPRQAALSDEEFYWANRYRCRYIDTMTPEENKELDTVLNQIAQDEGQEESDRIRNNLWNLKDTGWSHIALESLFVRAAVNRLVNGENPVVPSMLDDITARKAKKEISDGFDAIMLRLGNEILGEPGKCVIALNSSFVNCTPSPDCAKYCYAYNGHGGIPLTIIKTELVDFAVKRKPKEIAKRIADQFKPYSIQHTKNGTEVKVPLRLFEQGDGGMHYLPLIEELNNLGILVHIFSKRPDFLRKVDPHNIRLLSVDRSNRELADQNQDLRVAFVYSGKEDFEDLAKVYKRQQLGVLLGIELNKPGKKNGEGKTLPKSEFTYIYKTLGANASDMNTCAINDGTFVLHAKDGDVRQEWNCQKCGAMGIRGCLSKTNKNYEDSQFGLFNQLEKFDNEDYQKKTREILKRALELSKAIKEQSGENNDETRGSVTADGRDSGTTSRKGKKVSTRRNRGLTSLASELDDCLLALQRLADGRAEPASGWVDDGTFKELGRENREVRGRRTIPIVGIPSNRGLSQSVESDFLEQGGDAVRGTYMPRNASDSPALMAGVMSLMEKSDKSTFLHESAHSWIDADTMLAQGIAAKRASGEKLTKGEETFLKNLGGFFRWGQQEGVINLGVTDDIDSVLRACDTWARMTIDEQRGMHELFARGFEAYLIEGVSPNREMSKAFAQFRAWLMKIYANAINKPMPISREVRKLYDTMFISESEVEDAEQRAGIMALFSRQDRPDMTDEEFDAYEELQDRSREEANDFVAKAIAPVLKLYSKLSKDVRESFENEYADDIKERIAVLNKEPRFKARDLLLNGKDGNPALKLSASELKASGYSDETIAVLTRKGFVAGDEEPSMPIATLVAAVKAPSESDLISDLVESNSVDLEASMQIYSEERGDVDETYKQEVADEAAHNATRTRFLTAEYNAIARMLGEYQVVMGAVKQYAYQKLGELPVSELNSARFIRDEQRCANLAADYFRKGDFGRCLEFKRAQLLNHSMAALVLEGQHEYDVGMRRAKRASKSKSIDVDYRKALRLLFDRHDVRQMTDKDMSEFSETERADLNTYAQTFSESLLDAGTPIDGLESMLQTTKPVDEMTVNEMRDLFSVARQLENLGRKILNQNLTANAMRLSDVIEEGKAQLSENADKQGQGHHADEGVPFTRVEKFKDAIGSFVTGHVKIQTWCRIFDGGKDGGFFWNLFVRSANERAAFENENRGYISDRLSALLEPLFKDHKTDGDKVQIEGYPRPLSHGERLAVALNLGNESNKERLMDGDKDWTEASIGSLCASLTEDDWNAIQAIWDLFEEYRPLIEAKEKRVYGVSPRWIEYEPFWVVVKGGKNKQMKGGYFPVVYDPRKSEQANRFSAAEESKRAMQGAYQSSTTKRSFTIERVAGATNMPLRIDLSALVNGFNDVIHDLAWHEWLIETKRVLDGVTFETIDENGDMQKVGGRDTGIRSAIKDRYGFLVSQQFDKWREDIAQGDRLGSDALGARVWNALGKNVGIAAMGWSPMSAIVQLTGIGYAIPRVGLSNMISALGKVVFNPAELREEINAKSASMKTRSKVINRQVAEVMNQIEHSKNPMKRFGLAMLLAVQSVVDTATFQASYQKHMAEGMEEKDALAVAYQDVEDTQSGGSTHSMSAIERSQILKPLTVFYSWASSVLNQSYGIYKSEEDRTKAWASLLWMGMVMPVVEETLRNALKAHDPDDDKEKKKKEDPVLWTLRHTLGTSVEYHLGLLVGVRELANMAGATVKGERAFSYSGPAGLRSIQAAETLISASTDPISWNGLNAAIDLAGAGFGLPSTEIKKIVKGIRAIESGQAKGVDAVLAPTFGFEGRIK